MEQLQRLIALAPSKENHAIAVLWCKLLRPLFFPHTFIGHLKSRVQRQRTLFWNFHVLEGTIKAFFSLIFLYL